MSYPNIFFMIDNFEEVIGSRYAVIYVNMHELYCSLSHDLEPFPFSSTSCFDYISEANCRLTIKLV